MSNLAGQWIGSIYGTNVGNVFLDVEESNGMLKGKLRLNDPQTGVVVFDVQGEDNDKLELELKPLSIPDGVEAKPGIAKAVLQPDGSLAGRWETDLGTAGTFRLLRDMTLSCTSKNKLSVPQQFFFHRAPVGSIRLCKPDLERLIQQVSQDFVQGKVVVTYLDRGVEVTKFADAFLQNPPTMPLRSMKLSIQETEATSGLNRIINVDLVEDGGSLITTSSANESWVIGKGEMLRSGLKVHENQLVSLYRQYGMTINNMIFMILLVVIPGIGDWRARAACVASVFLLLTVLAEAYNRLVPNTLIFSSDQKPSWLAASGSKVGAWFFAILASVIAGLVVWFFTKTK